VDDERRPSVGLRALEIQGGPCAVPVKRRAEPSRARQLDSGLGEGADRTSALLEVRIFSARYFSVYCSGEENFEGAVSAGEEASRAPHPPQNSSPDSLANPHEGQANASGPPHFEQKRRPSRFSVWQRGHCIHGPASPDRERGKGYAKLIRRRWSGQLRTSWLAAPCARCT